MFRAARTGPSETPGGAGPALGLLTPFAAAAIIAVTLSAIASARWPKGNRASAGGYGHSDMTQSREILQIIPAGAGWRYAYWDRDAADKTFVATQPLACWALVRRDGGRTAVEGMAVLVATLGFCEDRPEFVAYVEPGVNSDVHLREAERMRRHAGGPAGSEAGRSSAGAAGAPVPG